jgi:predicted RNase H-like nuclease (RuvC/YqgF family)
MRRQNLRAATHKSFSLEMTSLEKLRAMGHEIQKYAKKVREDHPGMSHTDVMRRAGEMYRKKHGKKKRKRSDEKVCKCMPEYKGRAKRAKK